MSTAPMLAIQTPAHVSALTYTASGTLLVGSDDGSVRAYQPPERRVVKAIRGLGSEISSIALDINPKGEENGGAWVASGIKVMLFNFLKQDKLVFAPSDAQESINLSKDEDDVLNEIAINASGKSLAYSLDSGMVGVVELASRRIRVMKTRHTSICASVSFIPGRNNELASGGYDCALLHFNFGLGNTYSRQDFVAPKPESGVSFSPPFVLCLSVSGRGICAAGTADGQLWIGRGDAQSKRLSKSKKWEGLAPEHARAIKVADGPVVAARFVDDAQVVTCTLRGMLSCFSLSDVQKDGAFDITPLWTTEVAGLEKVNAVAVRHDGIAVGGFKDGKGALIILSKDALSIKNMADGN